MGARLVRIRYTIGYSSVSFLLCSGEDNAVLFLHADQCVQILALFWAERVAFGGVAKGDDQPGGGVNAGELPEFFVVDPASDTGG